MNFVMMTYLCVSPAATLIHLIYVFTVQELSLLNKTAAL